MLCCARPRSCPPAGLRDIARRHSPSTSTSVAANRGAPPPTPTPDDAGDIAVLARKLLLQTPRFKAAADDRAEVFADGLLQCARHILPGPPPPASAFLAAMPCPFRYAFATAFAINATSFQRRLEAVAPCHLR